MPFLNNHKKYVSLVLILLIILSNAFVLLMPKKTKALDVVSAPGVEALQTVNMGFMTDQVATSKVSLGQHIINTASNISNAVSGKLLETKEYVLDGLAWTAANIIIDKFADNMVTWIQSGFEGSPMFVTNPGRFLAGVGNDISGNFIDELNLEFLCEPLGELNLDLSFFFPGTSRSKYNCTFSDIVENFKNMGIKFNVNVNITQENIVREYQKDFRSGGWPMWLAMARPENNPDGRLLQATEEVWSMSEEKKEEERQTIQTGRGFLGMKVCLRYQEKSAGAKKCLEWKTTTPGSIVQGQLDKTLNKDVERLQVADEIDEIIGALAGQLINWVVTGGNGNSGLLGYSPQADNRQRESERKQRENREILQRKTDVIVETDDMRKWNSVHADAAKNQWGYLYDAKIKLEEIKNNLPSGSVIIVNNLSIEDQIRLIENEMILASTTALSAVAVEDKISSLLKDFNEKVLLASTKEEIDAIKDKYCYSYNKSDGKGIVCETENLPSPQPPKVTKYESFGKKMAEKAVAESDKVRQRMNDLIAQYGG